MRISYLVAILTLGLLLGPCPASRLWAQQNNPKPRKESTQNVATRADSLPGGLLGALGMRSIGPAFASGRIADFAMQTDQPAEYYVAVASGNLWKTTNWGTTWQPIFDNHGAWSMADIEIDPRNPNHLWLATGEYNSQRAIGYGDGIYLSTDRGKSFKNVGLKNSEHIGRIAIDPRNSHVYVAAQGPLWNAGGDRGLYKTEDQGRSWKKLLDVSENTGITDVVIDPHNPDVVYCASYQRRRHVWTLIDGGPESAIYRSVDAGHTWQKLAGGLPSGPLGRIGMAASPTQTGYVYAIIELPEAKGGIWRSTDGGESWEKRSDYVSSSPQYYNRLYCDPRQPDRLFSMDTQSKISNDGGRTWTNLGLDQRHVDDHALWIDPANNQHLLIGGDGGIYESWDLGQNWQHKENLPVTQFYRVAVDNSLPFYHIYGGTQDNNSMGGPSRSLFEGGIGNDEWFVTQGGDGFQSRVDPTNPNIVYAQSQYGGLTRYDRLSGQQTDIKPFDPADEAYRWNWNAPLIVSPHAPTRLYFGANKLLRSDDRGDTWRAVSPDLTRRLDRNQLPVMGKIQAPDAVAKNASTSIYGNITALDESRLSEGLLYVGTDDGLIQVSEDAGATWRAIETVADVPPRTYVAYLVASKHQADVVYACFDGRKSGDLRPMLYRSDNRGRSWTKLSDKLPPRGTVYTLAEDHLTPNLLFIGTEFGLYLSINGGQQWHKHSSGLPVTQVYDLAIQERENDLVLATFGRGFYVLDDYSPLRQLASTNLTKEAHIFAIKDALLFVPKTDKYGQGRNFYRGQNPSFGAHIRYHIRDSYESLKSKRQKAEKDGLKQFPSYAQLEAEANEKIPSLLFEIADAKGALVRKLEAPFAKGVHELVWDLRYPSTAPLVAGSQPDKAVRNYVAPGRYTVSIYQVHQGTRRLLDGPSPLIVKSLDNLSLPAADPAQVTAFQNEVAELARALYSANKVSGELRKNLGLLRKAHLQTLTADPAWLAQIDSLEAQLYGIDQVLHGNKTIARLQDAQPSALMERMGQLQGAYWRSTSAPTGDMRQQYTLISQKLQPIYQQLRQMKDTQLPQLVRLLDAAGSPYLSGTLHDWRP